MWLNLSGLADLFKLKKRLPECGVYLDHCMHFAGHVWEPSKQGCTVTDSKVRVMLCCRQDCEHKQHEFVYGDNYEGR